MQYNILSTGSQGNAVLLQGGILVDCGVAFSTLRPVLRDIRLVLLTHRHGDHFNRSTVRSLAEQRPTVRFCCREWMVPLLLDAGVRKQNIDVVPGKDYLGYREIDVAVKAVDLFHDVPNCGWDIRYGNTERVFYATDTGTLDGIKAPGYDLYMIEANHTREDIERRAAEKQERGEYAYEIRAAANHLSREQALDWLLDNEGPGSEFVLLHQHREEGARE